MEENAKKKSIFVTYEKDIQRMYKTEEEQERVRQLMIEAETQSKEKKIRAVRKVKSFSKFLTTLKVKAQYGIHWKHPMYPIRLARNFFLAYLYKFLGLNKFVFRGMEFAITFKCNFHCTHCLCARIDESDTREELTPKDYERIVNEAMALGATTFGLEGGEPLFKSDWQEIMKAFKPHYNHTIISTNGYLLDEKMIKQCAKLGVDTINFSLDSYIPELHDLFRRKRGSFDKVIEAINLCKKYGILPLINTVVHKGNLYTDGFIKLLEFAENEKVLINMLFAKGVGEFKDKDSMLDDDDLAAYAEIVRPYAYAHIHHSYEKHDGSINYNYGGKGCPGAKEMFNLTPYGDVINCANMHIYFGNLKEEPLKDVRKRVLKFSPLGKYRPCFLTLDKEFMEVYYPLLEEKKNMTMEEFNEALLAYEKKHNKVIYPELRK